MGQVIDFYSRRIIDEDPNYYIENNMFDLVSEVSSAAENSSVTCDQYEFVAYDPQMPIATEIFTDLDKSVLLEGCWVPLSWDENGIVVLIDNPRDEEKKAAVRTELRTEWVIFKLGTREDIEAFINQAFHQLEIDDLLWELITDTKPLDEISLVDIIISEAYLKGASEVLLESIPSSEKGCVWFLMDGEFREYMTVPDDVADTIIRQIMSLADLDVEDSLLPKIGNMRFKREGLPEFKVTVTTRPADGPGERIVLKIPESKNS
jgi:type II secretory ATPase GspE/PulE/Tfp pilus assembly ATPase PilB-like protein